MKKVDVAIAGASFAGLGVAYYLNGSGLDVLLIDRKEVGEGRLSTCGMPASLAEELAGKSILKRVGKFRVETPAIKRVIELPYEYCVIDYAKFCRELLSKCDAEFIKADVMGAKSGKVQTSKGNVEAEYIVDCTGWCRKLAQNSATRPKKLFFGMEITAPIDAKYENSLNFFLNKKIINGYCWIFPLGNGTGHVGAGGYCNNAGQLKESFMKFLRYTGVEYTPNELIVGGIPCIGLGRPVENSVFFAGDSARQVLPLSGEGIRTALYFADKCAKAIIMGRNSGGVADAINMYGDAVKKERLGFFAMKALQKVVLSLPQPAVDICVWFGTAGLINKRLAGCYLSIAED